MVEKNNRPLSPHLQVYRLPLTAKMSITHRLTGVFLTAGTLLLTAFLWATASGESQFICVKDMIGSPLGLIVMALWSWAFIYHLCNGIRHLFWDMGKGFDLACTHRANITVLIVSTLLTVGVLGAAWKNFNRSHQSLVESEITILQNPSHDTLEKIAHTNDEENTKGDDDQNDQKDD